MSEAGPGKIVLQKGAFVSTDPATQAVTTIPFQYNPATVRRTVEGQSVGGEPGGHSSAVRFTGSPTETVSLEIEIDALAPESTVGGDVEAAYGIHPQLAALELLLYPSTSALQANAQLLATGALEIAPYPAPLVLLVWGQNRSMPVKLLAFTIEEETFSPDLNPLRATVSVTAQVLSAADLAPGTAGYQRFIAYQATKEKFAGLANRRAPGG